MLIYFHLYYIKSNEKLISREFESEEFTTVCHEWKCSTHHTISHVRVYVLLNDKFASWTNFITVIGVT